MPTQRIILCSVCNTCMIFGINVYLPYYSFIHAVNHLLRMIFETLVFYAYVL